MNLVVIKNNQATTSSNKVAEVFGKRHDLVLRDINRLVGQLRECSDFNLLKNEEIGFNLSSYKDKSNRRMPAYEITRDGFTLLAMGFTGAKALQFKLKYIQAFNEMEEKLKNKVAVSDKKSGKIDDMELLRCLYAWHYTKNEEDTLKLRELNDENYRMKSKLVQLQALLK